MGQKQRILEMLKNSPEGVSCKEFADVYLYHKLASRCGELRRQGYDIIRIESHDGDVMKARYKLICNQDGLNSKDKPCFSPELFKCDAMDTWGGCQ